ncbi:MAG: acyl-ACP--UDP-N-acetylglucosamine O-acyltransferase [Candidatus Wallbacteria bacterium]|nr:acyl-ACP--UDP-N-acetylglucosamine O-acyltransferase [Candidatus Wallbacteria bacterium]
MKADISKKAQIGRGVKIGYGAVIGDSVEIGDHSEIGYHAVIIGHTRIGRNNKIHPGAVIGNITQALAYKGEESFVQIGDNNSIREYVTINASPADGTPTEIGNDNLIMAYSHIAHHCKVGNNVIIANSGTMGGHVTIEDNVVIGGLAAIHQFCRVGKLAIIGGLCKVVQDVVPFVTCDGNPAEICGLNTIGLKRAGLSPRDLSTLKKAYRYLFRSGLNNTQALKILEKELGHEELVCYLIDFIKNCSRGIIR